MTSKAVIRQYEKIMFYLHAAQFNERLADCYALLNNQRKAEQLRDEAAAQRNHAQVLSDALQETEE